MHTKFVVCTKTDKNENEYELVDVETPNEFSFLYHGFICTKLLLI